MAVRIRLLRMGKIRNPQYRIVVADARTKRDGRAIEFLGIYHPKEEPSRIEVNSERVLHWLTVGAQPSEPVRAILSKTGDWQKFKGLPAPPPLLVAAERTDRRAIYEAEAQAAVGVAEAAAPTTKPKKAAKASTAKAPVAAAAAPVAVATPEAAPVVAATPEAVPAPVATDAVVADKAEGQPGVGTGAEA